MTAESARHLETVGSDKRVQEARHVVDTFERMKLRTLQPSFKSRDAIACHATSHSSAKRQREGGGEGEREGEGGREREGREGARGEGSRIGVKSRRKSAYVYANIHIPASHIHVQKVV